MSHTKCPIPRNVQGLRLAICLFGLVGGSAAADPPAPSDVKAGLIGPIATGAKATPGSRITLKLDRPARPNCHYYWVQTGGPPVDLGVRTGPVLELTVPSGAESLAFVLVMGSDQGIETATFAVPIVGDPTPSGSLNPPHGPNADAGDDLIGLVGRRVTMNGSASSPGDGLGYRWIQVDGPPAGKFDDADRYCSFVPTAAGVYRFALVVARENRISPADFVTVSVGMLPAPGPTALGPLSQAVAPPVLSRPMPGPALEAAVTSALAALDDAPVVAGPLSDVFKDASTRLDLYRTYGEIFSEISRRLDGVIPSDPIRRARWNTLVFEPLTTQTIAAMLPLGLDLRGPIGQDALLTSAQKQELRGLYDRLSKQLVTIRQPR